MTDEIAAAYWEGAEQGRLVLQKCSQCGTIRHYPRVLCAVCWTFGVEYVEATGRGTVYSWTVAHHAFALDVVDQVPYTLATVDLPEGVRVMGRLDSAVTPATGLAVSTGFAPGTDGRPMLVFSAADPG